MFARFNSCATIFEEWETGCKGIGNMVRPAGLEPVTPVLSSSKQSPGFDCAMGGLNDSFAEWRAGRKDQSRSVLMGEQSELTFTNSVCDYFRFLRNTGQSNSAN